MSLVRFTHSKLIGQSSME